MTCTYCGAGLIASARFCGQCGGSVAATRSSPAPRGEPSHEPIRIGELSATIKGGLVPAIEIELGSRRQIRFENYILLWKEPRVTIAYGGLSGGVKRLIAGMPLLLGSASGPGKLAVSRENVGRVCMLRLRPGDAVLVREHQFLFMTAELDYSYEFVKSLRNFVFSTDGLFIDRFAANREEGLLAIHGYGDVFETTLAPGEQIDVEPGAWLWRDASVTMEAISFAKSRPEGASTPLFSGFLAGGAFGLNRFTGPGRLGVQSATFHAPQKDGSGRPEATTSVLGSVLGAILER